MTSNFIDQFGFNDEKFADQDDIGKWVYPPVALSRALLLFCETCCDSPGLWGLCHICVLRGACPPRCPCNSGLLCPEAPRGQAGWECHSHEEELLLGMASLRSFLFFTLSFSWELESLLCPFPLSRWIVWPRVASPCCSSWAGAGPGRSRQQPTFCRGGSSSPCVPSLVDSP